MAKHTPVHKTRPGEADQEASEEEEAEGTEVMSKDVLVTPHRNSRAVLENYIWDTLGWVFCETAFSAPDWLFWAIGWTYPVGNWFYSLSYTRSCTEERGG